MSDVRGPISEVKKKRLFMVKAKQYAIYSFFIIYFFTFAASAMTPFPYIFPTPNPPSLIISGPQVVAINETFTVEAYILEGSNEFSKLISCEAFLPEGFTFITKENLSTKKGPLWLETKKIDLIIRAPKDPIEKAKLEFHIKYLSKNNYETGINNNYEIYVRESIRTKFRVNTNSVLPDYNGNINLATLVETLPTFIPLGYFVLGDKREEATWINTYTFDSLIPKIIETFAFGFAITSNVPSSNRNSDRVWLCTGIYLYTLFVHDLPNLFKSHEERIEIAKLKREGKLKQNGMR